MWLFTVNRLFLQFRCGVFLSSLDRLHTLLSFLVWNFEHVLGCILGWVKVNKILKCFHNSILKGTRTGTGKRRHWYPSIEILMLRYWNIMDLTKRRCWNQGRWRGIVLDKCAGAEWETLKMFLVKGMFITQIQFTVNCEKGTSREVKKK